MDIKICDLNNNKAKNYIIRFMIINNSKQAIISVNFKSNLFAHKIYTTLNSIIPPFTLHKLTHRETLLIWTRHGQKCVKWGLDYINYIQT